MYYGHISIVTCIILYTGHAKNVALLKIVLIFLTTIELLHKILHHYYKIAALCHGTLAFLTLSKTVSTTFNTVQTLNMYTCEL